MKRIFDSILDVKNIRVMLKLENYRNASAEISKAIGRCLSEFYSTADVFVAGVREFIRSKTTLSGAVSELMFDINVVEVQGIGETHLGNQVEPKIPVISKPLWAVEIELCVDSREWATDFAKLVLSCSENKLFVVPKDIRNVKGQLEFFMKISTNCQGNLYLYLLDEDVFKNDNSKDDKMSLEGTVYQKERDSWVKLTEKHNN